MKKNQHDISGLTLSKLAIPLGIQLLLSYSLLLTDSFFLSRLSDNYAASVGAIFPLYLIFIILFNQIGQAGCSVASQYMGAKKFNQVTPTYLTTVIINSIFGIIMSFLLFILSNDIGGFVGLNKANSDIASIYIKITGAAFFLYALASVYNGILSSRGKTLPGMIGSIIVNIVNISLNIVFLYGFFGIPKLGIAGVAISTVVAQLIYVCFLICVVRYSEKIKFSFIEIKGKFKSLTKKILNIGIPATFEPASVQLMSFVITIMILGLGMTSMAAKTYAYNITSVIIAWSVAIGVGTQVLVAHAVGAKKFKKANTQLHKSMLISTVLIFTISLILYLVSENIFKIFTSNKEIIYIGKNLLLISVLMEPVRANNIIIQSSLVSAGDAKFSSFWGMVIMWVIGLPISYFLGIYLGFGIIGIWIGALLDEFIRGSVYYIRWRQRKWEKTSVVSDEIYVSPGEVRQSMPLGNAVNILFNKYVKLLQYIKREKLGNIKYIGKIIFFLRNIKLNTFLDLNNINRNDIVSFGNFFIIIKNDNKYNIHVFNKKFGLYKTYNTSILPQISLRAMKMLCSEEIAKLIDSKKCEIGKIIQNGNKLECWESMSRKNVCLFTLDI